MNLHDMLLKWNLEASKLHYPRLRFGGKAAQLPERLITPLQYVVLPASVLVAEVTRRLPVATGGLTVNK